MNRFYTVFVLVAVVVMSTTFFVKKNTNEKKEYTKYTPLAMEAAIQTDSGKPAAAPADESGVKADANAAPEAGEDNEEGVNAAPAGDMGNTEAAPATEGGADSNKPVETKVDIKTGLTSAEVYYDKGDAAKAIDEVEGVARVLRESQARDLAKLLPEQIEGWKVRTDKVDEDDSDKFVVGQTRASKEFVNDDKLVKVSIIIDSPLGSEIYNDATKEGANEGIGDYKGYVTKFFRSPESNRLVIVTGEKGVVVIEGFMLSHTETLKIADAINLGDVLNFSNR